MINWFLKGLFLTFPLNAITFPIGGYPFTLPSFFTIALAIRLFLRGSHFDGKSLPFLLIFLLWSFVSTLLWHGVGAYLLSLGLLFLLTIPNVYNYTSKELQGIIPYLYGGVLISLPFSLYDIGVNFIGLTPLEETYDLFSQTSNSLIFGYYRVKSSFTEPSYYGIYLCVLLYLIIDIQFKGRTFYAFLIGALILMTVSFTAYILSLFILLAYTRKNSLKSAKIYVLLAIVLFALPAVYEVLLYRLERTVSSVATSEIYGSEGMRANSIRVMIDYFKEADFRQFIMGEGYSYYDKWLIEAFQMYDPARIGFARGQIFNAFAIVGLSGGVIGLLLYSILLLSMAKSKYFTSQDILFHVLIQFSLAYMAGYLFWGILLMMRLKNHWLRTV